MINPWDKKLKDMARQENIPIPEQVHAKIEKTLENLPERITFRKPHSARRILSGIAACMALVLLVLLPNVSTAYAENAGKIPVLGKLVQVFTIRNYFYDDGGHYQLQAQIPAVNAPDFQDAEDLINRNVEQLTQSVIRRFYREVELNGNEGHGSIHIDYETVSSTEKWFTLKLMVTEAAGSSDQYSRFYHIDREKGRYVTFGDLFGKDGRVFIGQQIAKQMHLQMQEDPTLVYKIPEQTGGKGALLPENQNFYFNQEGDLVIAFDKYEVAPGFMGNPEFTIPYEQISAYLVWYN